MDPLVAARAQMEVSLGFHMVFAALGIAMPLLMVIAEGLYLRTGEAHYKHLAKKWGKATALLFAIGAVSGTALSFELGLLWPRFMGFAGGVIGPGFALEGYAFFVEAIFVGLYLYGWDRLSPRAHWLCGWPVALSGLASGVLVVAVNAWMQSPVGVTVVHGVVTRASPTAVFQSPVWGAMAVHSSLACYVAVGFAVAGVYAAGMLRGRADGYHRAALTIALAVAAAGAVLQLASGDRSAKVVARYEPIKLAAMEAHYETSRGVPLLVGGLPDPAREQVGYALRVPRGLSLLAYGDPDATVRGLRDFPRDERPNVVVSHVAFQVMVGAGFALIGLGVSYWGVRFVRWRTARRGGSRGAREPRWLLAALVAGSPLGFVALEAGWVVTEVGRQPWTVRGLLRTRDAVTPVASVGATFWVFTVLYVLLAVALVLLLRFLATGAPSDARASAEGAT